MAGHTTKVVKLQQKQIDSLQQQVDLLRHMLEELSEQVAEHNLRTLFHMRHTPVRQHKQGLLDVNGKPQTELTDMYRTYLDQRAAFVAKIEREIAGGAPERDLDVRTTGEQARIV